jgi:hypothetical protein
MLKWLVEHSEHRLKVFIRNQLSENTQNLAPLNLPIIYDLDIST